MKENVLRLGRLHLFLTFGVFFSFFSCNSDGEFEYEIEGYKTFLEIYDGTKWVVVEEYEGHIYYLRVNNNKRVPFELWGRPADLEKASKKETCYDHQNAFMDEEGVLIRQNASGRFIISYGDDEFWGLEIRGETLKFGYWTEWGDSDSNIWNNPDSIVFKKTTVNVDAFVICSYDYYGISFLR